MRCATSFAILLIALVALNVIIFAGATVFASSGNYYTYTITKESYEDGKQTILGSFTIKITQINATAYKVEMLSTPNRKNPFGFGLAIILKHKNVFKLFNNCLQLPDVPACLYMEPSTLNKAVSIAGKVNTVINDFCKAQGNLKEANEKLKTTLLPLDEALQDMLLALTYGRIHEVCGGKMHFTVNANKNGNTYTFTMHASDQQEELYVKTIYSATGHLIYGTYKQEGSFTVGGKTHEMTVIETVKLINTNDKTVKTAATSAEQNLGGSTLQVSTNEIVIGAVVGAIAITALAIALKKH